MRATAVRRRPEQRGTGDDGSAIIEFVFVAVLVMVPLVYLIVAVASVQRDRLGVANAAREAGRAYATSAGTAEGMSRARAAAQIAYTDAGLGAAVDVTFVAAGAACDAARIEPTLAAGAVFTVCVVRQSDLPAVPTVLRGRGITTEGRFTVHVDDYRRS